MNRGVTSSTGVGGTSIVGKDTELMMQRRSVYHSATTSNLLARHDRSTQHECHNDEVLVCHISSTAVRALVKTLCDIPVPEPPFIR